MKRLELIRVTLVLALLTFTLSSCEAIASIFKAGVWVGVLLVVGIIALVLYFIGRAKK